MDTIVFYGAIAWIVVWAFFYHGCLQQRGMNAFVFAVGTFFILRLLNEAVFLNAFWMKKIFFGVLLCYFLVPLVSLAIYKLTHRNG